MGDGKESKVNKEVKEEKEIKEVRDVNNLKAAFYENYDYRISLDVNTKLSNYNINKSTRCETASVYDKS